jgi:voltage-gated potassium channel
MGAVGRMKRGWRRALRAQMRDVRVLVSESRRALILFVAIVVAGALAFHFVYTFPDSGRHPGLGEALFAAFALIFFQPTLPYPEPWYLQVPFFLIPILGLAAVADGLLRFGSALIDKSARGQKWQVAMASTYSNHVIVCGLGKVGYRIILELLKFGREVVGIEENAEGRFVEMVKGLGVPVIIANARRSENLIAAGVKEADVVIPCTDDELTNLDIALDARELNPGAKIVMRMFDPDLARRIEKGFGIHTALSASALAAPIFAAAAMRLNVKHSFYVGDVLLNVSEVVIGADSALNGWTIARLEKELDLSVVCYQCDDLTDVHPDAELLLKAGDRILVLATLEVLQRLNSVNR